jgi:hypothetical protein
VSHLCYFQFSSRGPGKGEVLNILIALL